MFKRSIDFTNSLDVYSLDNFLNLKSDLISLINNDPHSDTRVNSTLDVHINRNDYHLSSNAERDWVKLFYPQFEKECLTFAKSMGFSSFEITAMWYQQYGGGDVHGWHHHGGSNYSGVFYLENEGDVFTTEFINSKSKEVFSVTIKEGEVCFFPAFVLHQSPKNFFNSKKTIISFNIDFLLFEEEFTEIKDLAKTIKLKK